MKNSKLKKGSFSAFLGLVCLSVFFARPLWAAGFREVPSVAGFQVRGVAVGAPQIEGDFSPSLPLEIPLETPRIDALEGELQLPLLEKERVGVRIQKQDEHGFNLPLASLPKREREQLPLTSNGRLAIKRAVRDAAILSAGPAQVILIRHGEKPAVGNKLNDKGRARAEAIVGFFMSNPAVTHYGVPAAIYAMAPSSADGSLRPIETVTPLAESLGLKIIEDYTKKEGLPMIKAIMSDASYAGKMVLICWEHRVIPDLVQYLGWASGPSSWPGKGVFDRAWILNFENGKPVSFQDVPEHLLPGDSAN